MPGQEIELNRLTPDGSTHPGSLKHTFTDLVILIFFILSNSKHGMRESDFVWCWFFGLYSYLQRAMPDRMQASKGSGKEAECLP